MHFTTRKTATALALALAFTGGGAAWAQAGAAAPSAEQPVPIIVPIMAPIQPADQTTAAIPVRVNGQTLEDTGYLGAGGETMLPLRAVAEAMGFELQWNPETYSVDLAKAELFTTVKTGENQYGVDKMLKELEAAPALVDSKLYVPSSFFGDILRGTVAPGNDGISITVQEEIKSAHTTGVVTLVRDNDGRRSLQIRGYGADGIVLKIDDQTEILDAEGNKLEFSALSIGMEVEVEHYMVMTMSLPPQTGALKIKVISALAEKDVMGTSGVIEEVNQKDDGGVSVRITGLGLTDSSPEDVVLQIAEDTVLLDVDGKAIDVKELTKGARVVGFYTPKLAKSLPPIGTALKVTLVAEADEE
ncbi:copper amine oxidase N-terminal domain-containing protein [Paenibacillus sp. YN15]|uniref:copper amine oxidase N-terminal domain-containing protein n=1 Tax=Paenibacillus sp. YN15 TaxID=1742774 RepID=UPI0015EB6F54|nr:copper amine oxidase N-terminal domain-containing protein [Paenibacillus sp. YN15]